MSQQTDEQQIRVLIAKWIEASRAGDLETVMNLMTDDVVFLTPDNPPMQREDFAARSRSMSGKVRLDFRSEVQEITVHSDIATCWNHLEVSITPIEGCQQGGNAIKRAGNTFSVFRLGSDGQWRMWRDANMLAPA